MTPRPALTVVVMGYRNQETIGEALTSLVEQDSPEPFEVVVVTSGGDRSAAVACETVPEIQVVDSPTRLMPGGARNAGVSIARGEIVAFLAADCLAEPGWVAARLRAHRAGHPVVAGAMTAAAPAGASASASHVALFCHRLPGRPAGEVGHPDAAAHGLSFDRAVLERLGPFDPELRVGEDTEVAQRLGAMGVPIWFEPAVRTAHRGPTSFTAMVRDHHRRGVTSAIAAGDSLRRTALHRAVPGYPVAVALVTRTTFRVAWHNSRGERLMLVARIPWLTVAVGAGLAGRYRVRLRRSRAGSAAGARPTASA